MSHSMIFLREHREKSLNVTLLQLPNSQSVQGSRIGRQVIQLDAASALLSLRERQRNRSRGERPKKHSCVLRAFRIRFPVHRRSVFLDQLDLWSIEVSRAGGLRGISRPNVGPQ